MFVYQHLHFAISRLRTHLLFNIKSGVRYKKQTNEVKFFFMRTYQLKRSEVDILHKTTMKIYHLLEEANLELPNLTPQMRYLITQEFSGGEWVRAALYFLRGIGNQHTLTGEQVLTLQGIADYYREHHRITPKQSVYVSNTLVDNWHQISYEYRSYATL